MKRGLKLAAAAVLSVMCALCFAFGVSAIAAQPEEGGAKSLSIDYANLKFEDNVYILYAAGSENIEDTSSIKLLVWESVPAEYTAESSPDYTLDVYNHQEINGVTYPVFCFTELAAKQMTDDVYVCAYYDDNGTPVYSEPFKYSILQYAYNMRNGGTDDDMLQDLLYSMLNYGSAAQRYYNYNIERPADGEYVNVKVNGGTLSDGFTYGLYLRNSEVVFTAHAEKDGHAFSHWVDNHGEPFGYGETTFVYDVYDNTTVSAVYEGLAEIIDIELPSEILLGDVDDTEVSVRYNDKNYNKYISPRDLNNITAGSVDWDAAGTYTFTAEYEGFTKQFTVTIVDLADREIVSINIKDTYLGEDPIVSIEYNVGGSEYTTLSAMKKAGATITDTKTEAPFDLSSAAAGEYYLYIEYNGSGADAYLRLIDPNDTTVNGISCNTFIVTVDESGELIMRIDGFMLSVSRNNNTTSYVPLTEDMISYDESYDEVQIKEIAQNVLDTGEPACVDFTITYEGYETGTQAVLMPETKFENKEFNVINAEFFHITEGRDYGTLFINRSQDNPLSGCYIRYDLEISGEYNFYYAYYYESVNEVYDESGGDFDVMSCQPGSYYLMVQSTFHLGWKFNVSAYIFTNDNVYYEGDFSGSTLVLNAGTTEEEAILAATENQATLYTIIRFENSSTQFGGDNVYLTAEMIDFSGVNFNTVGEQNFTVTYNGTEYTFTVTILPGGEECLFTNVVMEIFEGDALIDEEGHFITVTTPYGEKRVFTYATTARQNVIKVNMGDGYPQNYYYIDRSGDTVSLYPWQPSGKTPTEADGLIVFTLDMGGANSLIKLVDIGEDGTGYAEMYMTADGVNYLLAYTLDATVTFDGEGNVTGGSAFGMEFIVRGTALIPVGMPVECTVTYISIDAVDSAGYLDEENRMLVVYTDSVTAEYSFEYLKGYDDVITLFSPGTDIPTLYAYIDRTFPDAYLIMPWVSTAGWNESMGFPQASDAAAHIYAADLSGQNALVAFIYDDINGGYYAVIYSKMPELGEEGYIPLATVAATVEADENGAFTSVNFMGMNFTVTGDKLVEAGSQTGGGERCLFTSHAETWVEVEAILNETERTVTVIEWAEPIVYTYELTDKTDIILLHMGGDSPDSYYYIDRPGEGKVIALCSWQPSGETPTEADAANDVFLMENPGYGYFIIKITEPQEDGRRYAEMYRDDYIEPIEENVWLLAYTVDAEITADDTGAITEVTFEGMTFTVQENELIPQA